MHGSSGAVTDQPPPALLSALSSYRILLYILTFFVCIIPVRYAYLNSLQDGPMAQNSVRSTMSWLTPKRRRTTGNLKSVPGGTNGQAAQLARAVSDAETIGEDGPATPTRVRAAVSQRPPTTPTGPRPLSQPVMGSALSSPDGSGNLFYAYARRVSFPRFAHATQHSHMALEC